MVFGSKIRIRTRLLHAEFLTNFLACIYSLCIECLHKNTYVVIRLFFIYEIGAWSVLIRILCVLLGNKGTYKTKKITRLAELHVTTILVSSRYFSCIDFRLKTKFCFIRFNKKFVVEGGYEIPNPFDAPNFLFHVLPLFPL